MLQKFVLGTLATLNSVIAPLTGPANLQPTYRLDVNESLIPSGERCSESHHVFLGLQTEAGVEGEVTVRIQGQLCRSGIGSRPIAHTVKLPIDLMDAEFIERLPSGASYVAAGIPSTQPGRKEHVKIIRSPEENDLTPIRIEWLPHDDGRVSHQPMTIWFGRTAAGHLPWVKIEMSEITAMVHQPLTVAGEIESPRPSRSRL